MKRIILLLPLLILSASIFAQPTTELKDLNISDAVLKQRTDLAPQTIRGLQWIKGSSELCYMSDDMKSLLRRSPRNKKAIESITVAEINKSTGLELKSVPRVTWTSGTDFYFQNGGKYYTYNTGSKKSKMILEMPANAGNVDYHVGKNQAAYTVDHNLFIIGANGSKPVVTVDNPNIVSGQAIARFEFGIRKGTFWSPAGDKLAFYQKDESKVSDYPLLDITSVPGKLTTTKYPMAGQGSEKASVGVYDVKSESLVYLDVEGPEDQYLTNLGWGPQGEYIYLAVVNRDQNHMALNKYDAVNGKLVKTLFEEKHPKYVEPENPVWFMPGNDSIFLWQSERDGYNHIYSYTVNGDLKGQITKGNWVVSDILGLSNSGKKLIVTGFDPTGLNHYAYAIDMESGNKEVLSDNSGVHLYQLSDDGIHLIDDYSSLKTPHVIDVINTRGSRVVNLLAATNPLRGHQVGSTEIVDIKAEDGTVLHARMIKPSNFEERKKYPVLVYVYGGPHAQLVSNSWLSRAPLWMHYMAERGFIVWTLDNRGSANRGFDFENVIHRQLGTIEVQDQLAGVEYLKGLPYIDANRMAVHGWSYGGFMTTSLMLKAPGVFKAGVAGGPVTDWKYYEVMYGERYMDRPEENPKGYQESSLLNHVKNLQGDLLLIHGTVDDIVVMQHSLDLIDHFVDEGIQVDFFAYPMHPHNVRGKDRVHLMTKVLNYVEDKLRRGRP